MARENMLLPLSGEPPFGWRRGHVRLPLRSGLPKTVEAFVWRAFAVHAVEYSGREFACLSHRPTGYRIAVFECVHSAAVAAGLIEPLRNDWDTIVERVQGVDQRDIIFDRIGERFTRDCVGDCFDGYGFFAPRGATP